MAMQPMMPQASLFAEVPEELYEALQDYVESHPTWSQHRIFCAALSLFLIQNDTCDRNVNRIYLDALFDPQDTSFKPCSLGQK